MTNPQSNPGKGTILLTGSNGSLGSKMVSQIASSPELAAYHGLYTVRDAQNAPVLRSALAQQQPQHQKHPHDIISLDITDLASVRAFAASISARVAAGEIPPIRALILNAGYLEFTSQTWTAEGGFDMTFASNYLGHWLLTVLLLGSMDRQEGRVVVVGSEAHDPFNPKGKGSYSEARFQEFMRDGSSGEVARGTWSSSAEDPSYNGGFRRYGASKFCQAMMM